MAPFPTYGVTFYTSASLQAIALSIILSILYYVYVSWTADERPLPGFPVATLPQGGLGPKESYFKDAQGTIAANVKLFSGPFQIITGTGPKVVLPNKYADELRGRPELDFNEAFRKDFFAHYPGFEGFRASMQNPELIPSTLRVKVSQSLGLVTNHLVEETTAAVHELYGESSKWQSIAIKEQNLRLIARLSSRVFLGKPVCRNERWLEIARGHTTNCFMAAGALRAQPFFLRRIMHLFMPHNKAIQQHYRDAKRIINPEVQMRKKRAEEALAVGDKPLKMSDTVGWMVEMSRGKKVDYVAAQLSLTVAAIHATTEALTCAMADLVAHPKVINELREEIIHVVGEAGWTKQALYKMKLMDSFLKESQRMHPSSPVSMNRKVMRTLKLSDGTVLPKGTILMVAGKFQDPEVFTNPEEFDAKRFLKLRGDDLANNTYQYTSTSADMFGFGHGKHACPGRFLASNELKVALAHLLLKYDWEEDENDRVPKFFPFELANTTNSGMKLMLKRRTEEIVLDLDRDADLIDVEE